MLSVAPFSVGLLINQMGASDRLLFCGDTGGDHQSLFGPITQSLFENSSVAIAG